jgi:hypothetical protein
VSYTACGSAHCSHFVRIATETATPKEPCSFGNFTIFISYYLFPITKTAQRIFACFEKSPTHQRASTLSPKSISEPSPAIYQAILGNAGMVCAHISDAGSTHLRCSKFLEIVMLKLCVYYHGVLRYTIVANKEKAQSLRNKGFYVVAEPIV